MATHIIQGHIIVSTIVPILIIIGVVYHVRHIIMIMIMITLHIHMIIETIITMDTIIMIITVVIDMLHTTTIITMEIIMDLITIIIIPIITSAQHLETTMIMTTGTTIHTIDHIFTRPHSCNEKNTEQLSPVFFCFNIKKK